MDIWAIKRMQMWVARLCAMNAMCAASLLVWCVITNQSLMLHVTNAMSFMMSVACGVFSYRDARAKF
jgi:hypothetical protein